MPIYSKKQAQVEALLFNKVFTEVLIEYFDYNNIFLPKNVAKLLENIKINKYTIKLKEDKQLSFKSIYSLELIELKMLKTYINTNSAIGFIYLFISSIGIFILFN